MSSSLILISINTFIHLGSFILLSIGFASPQWNVYTQNCGACENQCIWYIGLLTEKYTKFGTCTETKKDTSCNIFDLNQDDCDSYTASRQAGKLALSLVVILVVWKCIVTGLSWAFLKTKTRIIWILILLASIGDLIIGFCAFISAGEFDAVKDWNIINVATGKNIEFDHGLGWQCFIGGGVVSWVLCVLGVVTLFRKLNPEGNTTTSSSNLAGNIA